MGKAAVDTKAFLFELHNVCADLRSIDAALNNEDDPQREGALIEARDWLLGELTLRAEDFALLIDEKSRRAEQLRAIAREYTEKAKNTELAVERYKATLLDVMSQQGVSKIPGTRATVTVCASPEAVRTDDAVFDLDLIPDDYVKVVRSLDATKAKAALQAGEEVPGCYLDRGEHVRIRLA